MRFLVSIRALSVLLCGFATGPVCTAAQPPISPAKTSQDSIELPTFQEGRTPVEDPLLSAFEATTKQKSPKLATTARRGRGLQNPRSLPRGGDP